MNRSTIMYAGFTAIVLVGMFLFDHLGAKAEDVKHIQISTMLWIVMFLLARIAYPDKESKL